MAPRHHAAHGEVASIMFEQQERAPAPPSLAGSPVRAPGERRGRPHVFLGAAPGVGRTFAMLEAAQAGPAHGLDALGRSETGAS